MSAESFVISVPGKWVLAGEHAVLRGGLAVALPHPEYRLDLRFAAEGGAAGLEVRPPELAELVRRLLSMISGTEEKLRALRGSLTLASTIPLGAGLGSSAAICVSLTRLASRLGAIPESEIRSVATRLEDYFHGKSSGMDVAVIVAGRPVLYRRGEAPVELETAVLPRFTFHDTGMRAGTKACIEAVESLQRRDPEKARAADGDMMRAAEEARTGLLEYGRGDRATGLRHLQSAFELGQAAYASWGLLPPEAREMAESLRAQGALAVKLTGAGGGGFLVALWPEC